MLISEFTVCNLKIREKLYSEEKYSKVTELIYELSGDLNPDLVGFSFIRCYIVYISI